MGSELKVSDAEADALGMPASVAQRVVDFYANRLAVGGRMPIAPIAPSRNDVLEEAAKVAEKHAKEWGEGYEGQASACLVLANALRALKDRDR